MMHLTVNEVITIGDEGEYTKEDFSVYICRLEIYLVWRRKDAYCLPRDLPFPRVLEEVSLLETLQVLWDHYTTKMSVIVECFRFNQQKQSDEESVMVYIAELQKLSINYTFGNTLNDMLRDRLVCGLSSLNIQKVLQGAQICSSL